MTYMKYTVTSRINTYILIKSSEFANIKAATIKYAADDISKIVTFLLVSLVQHGNCVVRYSYLASKLESMSSVVP